MPMPATSLLANSGVMNTVENMVYERTIAYFEKLLRENPKLPCPRPLVEPIPTEDYVFEHKSAMRAYDEARMRLKIATPAQIQEENSIIKEKDVRRMRINWESVVHARIRA